MATAPSVTNIAPLWIAPGSTKNIVIRGTGFSAPVTVTMGAGITVNGTPSVDSATQITANVTAAGGAALGTRTVRVTLTDTSFGERDLLAVSEAFTLKGTANDCGFTADEQTVLNRLGTIASATLNNVLSVQSEIGILWMTATGTTVPLRQALFTAWVSVYRKIALVAAYLVHADRGSSAPALNSTGVGASPGTRAQWIAAAQTEWTALGTALTAMRTALQNLQTATAVGGTAPGSASDQFRRAQEIRMRDTAIAAYTAVGNFSSRTYSTPYPDDITGGGSNSTVRVIPQVAAVHGDYRMAQWALYRAMHHYADVLEYMNTIVGDDKVVVSITISGDVYTPAHTLVDRLGVAAYRTLLIMFANAQLPNYKFAAPSGRTSMNPRFNTAVEGPRLLMQRADQASTVFRIHEINADSLSAWVTSSTLTGSTSLTAFGNMAESMAIAWKNNDQSAWASIFFNSSLIPSLIAQAGDRQGEVVITTGRYTFTRMDPPSLKIGSSMSVTVQGTGFENGMVPSFSMTVGHTGTMGVTIDSYSVKSATELHMRITTSASATAGLRDLTLTPPGQVTGGVPTALVAVLGVGQELPLKGGFSAAETTAIQHLYDGLGHLCLAVRTAVPVLGAAGVSRAQQKAIFTHAAGVLEDFFKGIGYLLHSEIGPNGPPLGSTGFDLETSPPFGPLNGEPTTRTGWVLEARKKFDRIRGTNLGGDNGVGVNHLTSLSTALQAAIDSGSDAAVDTALGTAKNTHVAAAITEFAAANLALNYSTPFPDDFVGDASPSVVHTGITSFTTHGGHRTNMFGHSRAMNYIFEQDAFYRDMIETATFSSYTAMKAYATEIFTQFPIAATLFLVDAGVAVRTISPPPGTPFENMNDRMQMVASVWDEQTNFVDLSGDGFIGGDSAMNASYVRLVQALKQLVLDIDMNGAGGVFTTRTAYATMLGKTSDSWRNNSGGIDGGMRWNFSAAITAPTTRTLSALPSTAPTIRAVVQAVPTTSITEIELQSGQAMAPVLILTTGSTGATPTLPSISVTVGDLPSGITLTDNGNGTALLSGTPSSGSETVTFTANNGTGSPADLEFDITVQGGVVAPTITSLDHVTFTVNHAGTFTVMTSTTDPVATLTKTGTLPTGVTFTDNGNGTATIAGTPTQVNTFAIIITAANGGTPDAAQNFTLTVQSIAKRIRNGVRGKP